MEKFKCKQCLLILNQDDLTNGNCPECNMLADIICENDHICNCALDITGGTQKCTICGEFTCPCGSHNAFVISRVTGYVAELGGWGEGKKAEFNDRQRYDVT